MPSRKKSGVDVRSSKRSARPKANISRRPSPKGRTAPEILPKLFPKKSPPSTGPKTCTGASAESSSCAPCAGWWPCSMARSFRWNVRHSRRQDLARPSNYRSSSRFQSRSPRDYVEALRTAKVLARAEREHEIRKALDAATRTIPGARWREDKPLVATVVNLTEFPSAILGNFDPSSSTCPKKFWSR